MPVSDGDVCAVVCIHIAHISRPLKKLDIIQSSSLGAPMRFILNNKNVGTGAPVLYPRNPPNAHILKAK